MATKKICKRFGFVLIFPTFCLDAKSFKKNQAQMILPPALSNQ